MAELGIERLGSGGAGTPGAAGRDGVPGFPGEDGEYGMMFVPPGRGGAGTPGATGATGADGQVGPPGPAGEDGSDFGMWVPAHARRHDHSNIHDGSSLRALTYTATAVGANQFSFTDTNYSGISTGVGIAWPGGEAIWAHSAGYLYVSGGLRVGGAGYFVDALYVQDGLIGPVRKVITTATLRPPVYFPNDGDDGFFMPGPKGVAGSAGAAGATGARGRQGPPGLPGDDGDQAMFIPGKRGATGPVGGGGGSATTVETDTGSTPKHYGKFTITDAGISATSKVLCWQAPGPYTGKGTSAGSTDEATMDPIKVTAVVPAAGSAVVYWETHPIYVPILGYMEAHESPPATTVLTNTTGKRQDEAAMVLASPSFGRSSTAVLQNRGVRRLGKVKGNIKFSYVTFA